MKKNANDGYYKISTQSQNIYPTIKQVFFKFGLIQCRKHHYNAKDINEQTTRLITNLGKKC